jgi:hypothetical protein
MYRSQIPYLSAKAKQAKSKEKISEYNQWRDSVIAKNNTIVDLRNYRDWSPTKKNQDR